LPTLARQTVNIEPLKQSRGKRFQLARGEQQEDFLIRMMPEGQDSPEPDYPAENHLSQADAVQSAIFQRMSPSRKLELAVAMNRQAHGLMDSGLRQAQPEFSAEQRRIEIAR